MTTFTREQLEEIVKVRSVAGDYYGQDTRDLAAFALAQMDENETLRAIALTAEHLCKYDGSKAMTAKGHYYDAQKAMEFSDRLHELLAEWRKGQKEGRW